MVANTNLKNCFIKKYNLFIYANLAIQHCNAKSNINIICYNMVNVFLLLGSNLGDRLTYLKQAIAGIGEMGIIIKTSSVYETQALGKTTDPDYLNQVLLLETALPPRHILETIWQIEQDMGRERVGKWGSRTIDIDILFYDNKIINEPGLIIPHPELHKRRFTLEPLSEIAPDFIHPLLNASILKLKNTLADCMVVKKL